MGKVRLNKTEREAIIRKIKKQVMDNYYAKKKEVEDSYKPSKHYLIVKKSIEELRDTLLTLQKLIGSGDYVSSFGYAKYNDFGKSRLVDIMVEELKDSYPEYPNIKDEEIHDALILGGISEDFNVEDFIKGWVEKF